MRLIALLLLLLQGCIVTDEEIPIRNGVMGFRIETATTLTGPHARAELLSLRRLFAERRLSDATARADAVCPHGFRLLDRIPSQIKANLVWAQQTEVFEVTCTTAAGSTTYGPTLPPKRHQIEPHSKMNPEPLTDYGPDHAERG